MNSDPDFVLIPIRTQEKSSIQIHTKGPGSETLPVGPKINKILLLFDTFRKPDPE